MASIGIEWVNQYHGRASNLANNDENARGFANTLQGTRSFEYGDDLAWDQDFEQSGAGSPTAGTDQLYADNVDIAFFSGHGSTTGIMFGIANRDDGWARPSDMRLGDSNLEWIVFDACQVLDWDNGAVWNRIGWPVFTGLHQMLGFHTTCGDVKGRGDQFAQRLNAGWSVRDAWIRACIETEGGNTMWAVLRANAPGADTFADHWWGKGPVSNDPTAPDWLFYSNGNC